MAIATYTTDLTTINVVDTAGGVTNWTAIGGGASGLASETDFYIQGNACISKAGWSAAIRGMIFTTTAITLPTNNAIFMWLYMWAPNALSTQSAGGLQVIIGSSTTAYKHWYVRGSDTYEYGGWICVPIDPTTAVSTTTGAPTATLSNFGALANITGAVTKGNPLGIDVFRYGRSLITVGGQTGSYGNFASASSTDDGSGANRWGILQEINGAYLHQGLFLMGTASTLVDFRDSNKNINIADTQKVTSGFNGFEVRNTSSVIQWTNINISALGTQSRGYFEDVNDATITFNGCVFTDMSTFTFKSKNTINSSTFRRVGVITQNNALINDCLFDSSQYLLSSNPSRITNNSFVAGATGHGIWISTPGTYSFTGNSFTGYASTNGSTGNEALYNNSGGLVTLNLSGGTVPTYRNNGAGSTTSIIASVNVTVTGLKDNTEIRVYTTATITELAGIETATDGTTDNRSFTFALTAGVIIDIAIINVTYENERITAYTVPATNASIPVQQRFDRNYSNPV